MSEPALFEALGGEAVLRAIIDHFVDHLFDDLMIGYLFRSADRQRVKAKEYEFAAQHLGAAVVYTGRPLALLHRAQRISFGQFMRRLELLKQTLAAFDVPAEVTRHWVMHTLSLQGEVTDMALDSCLPGQETDAQPVSG
jgi:truncated hemoglobin YjbI